MINKVSDLDRALVSNAAMIPNNKHALDMFLYGESKIIYLSITKRKEFTDVYISSSNHFDLHFCMNKTSFESLEKILTLHYSYLRIVYTKDTKSAFSSYINIDWLCVYNEILRITSKIYQDNIADDDEKWNNFCESEHDDYMLLLSEYLNENARFTESLNKRLEAASDSDKLLAMIGDK